VTDFCSKAIDFFGQDPTDSVKIAESGRKPDQIKDGPGICQIDGRETEKPKFRSRRPRPGDGANNGEDVATKPHFFFEKLLSLYLIPG
jgi:hypothetical protein